MNLRAWGLVIALASCTTVSAGPIAAPTQPSIDGTATPALMQEYFQADPAKNKVATAQLHREVTPRPGLPVAEVVIRCFQIATCGCR